MKEQLDQRQLSKIYYLNDIVSENQDYSLSLGFKKVNGNSKEGFIWDRDPDQYKYRSAIWYHWEQDGQRRFLHIYSPLATTLTINILINLKLLYTDPALDPGLDKIKITQILSFDTSILNQPLEPFQRSFNFQQAKTAIRLIRAEEIVTFKEIQSKWEAYLYLTQILRIVDSRSIAEFVGFYALKNWDAVEIFRQQNKEVSAYAIKDHFFSLWRDYEIINPKGSICEFMESIENKS